MALRSVPICVRTHFCHVLACCVITHMYEKNVPNRSEIVLVSRRDDVFESNRSVYHPDEPKMVYSREQTAVTVKYDFRTVPKVNRSQRTNRARHPTHRRETAVVVATNCS